MSVKSVPHHEETGELDTKTSATKVMHKALNQGENKQCRNVQGRITQRKLTKGKITQGKFTQGNNTQGNISLGKISQIIYTKNLQAERIINQKNHEIMQENFFSKTKTLFFSELNLPGENKF